MLKQTRRTKVLTNQYLTEAQRSHVKANIEFIESKLGYSYYQLYYSEAPNNVIRTEKKGADDLKLLPAYSTIHSIFNKPNVPVTMLTINKLVYFYNKNIHPSIERDDFINSDLKITHPSAKAIIFDKNLTRFCHLYYGYYYNKDDKLSGFVLNLKYAGNEVHAEMISAIPNSISKILKCKDILSKSKLRNEEQFSFQDFKNNLPDTESYGYHLSGIADLSLDEKYLNISLTSTDKAIMQKKYIVLDVRDFNSYYDRPYQGGLGFCLNTLSEECQFYKVILISSINRKSEPCQPIPFDDPKLTKLLKLTTSRGTKLKLSRIQDKTVFQLAIERKH